MACAANGEMAAGASKTPVENPAILVYVGLCTGGQDYANEALANLGYANVTTVTTLADFQTQLAFSWNLIIYDGYYSFLNTTILDMLKTKYDSGGRIIFSDANVLALKAHSLFSAAGVSIINEFTVPEPLYPWQNDPLFITPNEVPPITVLSDLCNRDGVHLEPVAGLSTAHAGATETAETNKALLTVDAKRHFIFNGFAPQTVTGDQDSDSKPDMVELYENEIHHLLAGGNGALVFFSTCNGGLDYFSDALDMAGLSNRTVVYNQDDFLDQLNTGNWRLVIVDAYDMSIDSTALDALVRHYNSGGKTILYTWNLLSLAAHPFFTLAGANPLSNYSTPQPIYDWDVSNLFKQPWTIPDLTALSDLCPIDGQYLQATTGIALAGNTPTYDATKATIVMDAHRRILLNGFAPQNVTSNLTGYNDMTALYENEINLLLWGGRGTLVYIEACGGSPDYISPALANLGITDVTRASDALDFTLQLASGTWDTVIYEAYRIDTTTETLDALLNFFDKNQGSLVISLFDLKAFASHPLFSDRAGITVGSEYGDPQPIYAWNQSILFQAPNEVPTLSAFSNPCATDGQFMEVTTATAHAGYTADPSANNTAIAVNQSKRLIVNGFIPGIVTGDADGDLKDDMVELYENEILYSRAGTKVGTLVLFNDCFFGQNYVEPAAANLGLSRTIISNETWFRTYLAAGDWGTVIYDSYSAFFPNGLEQDLTAYYDQGGRIILSAWDLTSYGGYPILDRAGISVGSQYNTPEPIYAWDVSPFFDTPNLIPNLTIFSDLCDVDGQYLQPGTASAVAGFTASPQADTAAITMDAQSRFIVNGFMPQNVTGDEDGDTKLDMVELYENELNAVQMATAERSCPAESFFSQIPYAPPEAMGAWFSDVDLPYTVYENFNGLTDPIGQIVWWGLNCYCDAIPATDTFSVGFYEDNAGLPGNLIYEETVTPIREKVDVMYYVWWLYQYTVTLAAPQSIDSGWLKIRVINSSKCTWGWMSSGQGDHFAYQEGSGPLNNLDFGVCFIGASASGIHSADTNSDYIIGLSELLRVIQFFNSNGFHCQAGTEDGFAPGPGDTSCAPYDSDYNPTDWQISLSELLRVIQFFNSGGYHYCPGDGTEDGYCPGQG